MDGTTAAKLAGAGGIITYSISGSTIIALILAALIAVFLSLLVKSYYKKHEDKIVSKCSQFFKEVKDKAGEMKKDKAKGEAVES